jgi:hypothetical protein
VQFVFTPSGSSSELIPGFNVQPNLRVALRQTQRGSSTLVIDPDAAQNVLLNNTVLSTVESPAAIDSPISDNTNANVTVIPVDADGSGGLDLISKTWDNDQVDARSAQQTSSTLSWGTGGLGFPSVMVSDTADPETTNIADSAFDAFDLVSIPKITTSMDPLLTFDKVASVELYNGTDWVPVEDNPCTGTLCDGKFPGYTLSVDEQESTVGVRVEFIESPTRAARIGTNPFAPLVGTGVASSMDMNRQLKLLFQLRDTRRSDGEPVLGTTRGIHYNADDPGFVTNSARVSGRSATDSVLRTDTDADDIQIVDHPINVTAAKTWDDVAGPLGLPPVGTPQKMYPRAPLVVTGTNASLMRVNSLAVAEPSGSSHPFDYVNLFKIDSITVPSGTISSSVTLLPASAYPTPYTIAQALALSSDDLADVTGIVVKHSGRIASTASTVVSLDTQLRATVRGTGEPSTARMVDNTMTATIVDPGGTAPPTAPAVNNTLNASASAQVAIKAFQYDVIATKDIAADTPATNIAPAIQYDHRRLDPDVLERLRLHRVRLAQLRRADRPRGRRHAHRRPLRHDDRSGHDHHDLRRLGGSQRLLGARDAEDQPDAAGVPVGEGEGRHPGPPLHLHEVGLLDVGASVQPAADGRLHGRSPRRLRRTGRPRRALDSAHLHAARARRDRAGDLHQHGPRHGRLRAERDGPRSAVEQDR